MKAIGATMGFAGRKCPLVFGVLWLQVFLPLASGTLVVSNITVDQTWTAADSPYFICYPATVVSNVTLRMEPGTVVILGKGEQVGVGHYLAEALKIEGTLIAEGALFTSWTNPSPAAWDSLQFLPGSVGRLTNCTVEYGGAGAVTYGLVHASGSVDLEFTGCLFRYGEYSGDSGVYMSSSATGTVRFTNCIFTNLNIGITTERDSGVDVFVDGCVFDNLHAHGVLLRNKSAEIRNCSFRNILNTDVVLWESYVNNWWCKTASLIGNQFDGGGKGTSPVLMYGAVNFSAAGNSLSGYAATNSGVVVGGWVPKGWSAVWSASDLPYIMRETVTVDGDGSSLGTLTIHSGSTIRQYPDAALRVWGNLTVAGTPTSRVVFTTALGTPTGNGIWINSGWGEVNVQHADFNLLNRGCFVGWTYTPTVRVSFTQCHFSNIADRAFDLLDGIGHQVLRVSDSAIRECGTTLYTDRGGSMTFSNVLFRDTGPIRFVNWGNNALFENCAMIGMRKSGTVQPISGAGAGAVFRHCTIVQGEGVGVEAGAAIIRDSIIWGHLEQAIGSTTITASYSCIEGGYTGPGSNNLMVAPGFIGWGGGSTVFVDAAASCPGNGSATNPFCSLANAIAHYRAGYNYGLATNSPCIGAASDGGNIGASLGVGAAGAASLEIRVAPGTYGLGRHNLLMGISLIGAGPNSVAITNTIKGLQSGARLEGVTIASAQNRGLEIFGPRSPTVVNCVFSNLTNSAIYIYNGYPTSVEACAPTITAVRIRDIYSASSPVDGIYIEGTSASWKTKPEIRNCLFHNIRSGASDRQGALHAYYASPLVLNCTFYTNKIGLCSAGTGTVTVWNCISYQNSTADIRNEYSAFRIGHCDYGTYSVATPASLWTTNNLNADPMFVNRNAYDLRLLPDSPCINRGTNQAWMVGATDFFGNPRLLHGIVDIGAYEHLFEWPMIGVSPTAMTVRAATTDTIPDRYLDVWNAGAGTLTYTITSNAAWLNPAPISGTSTGETDTITIGFQTVGMAVGNYTGLITIVDTAASNSPRIVPVILQLQAPAIRCLPTGIAFSVTTGANFPSLSLQISNAAVGTMSYTISTNAAWLSVSPVTGVSTGETDFVSLSFQTEFLAEGSYTGLVTITSAEATNSPVIIPVFVKVLDYNRALNTTNLPWRSGGSSAWFLQTNTTHDGIEAARSGPIGDSQTSWVEVAVSGPAKLSFWWRVSSESGFDFLRFYMDTTLVASISGTSGGWLAQTNIIPDGTHLLRWAYIKDTSASAGSDCGWLDEVRYVYDSDGDGLPDVFEEQYWGDPVSTNVWDGDFDGDGYSNGDEFLADSNPLNNASMPPRFTNVTVGAISQCDLAPTSTQRFYHVSATTNLLGTPAWIPVATNMRGNAGALQFVVTNDPPVRFYRAVITRPP